MQIDSIYKSKVSLTSGADMPCTSSVLSPLACHKCTDPGKQLLGQACKTAGSWGFVWATVLGFYRETFLSIMAQFIGVKISNV